MLAVTATPLKSILEGHMSLHMLVQFPALVAAGWMAVPSPCAGRLLSAVDAHGLLCGTVTSCVLAVWMIPAALDLSLLNPVVAAIKYASWMTVGGMLSSSRIRFEPVIAAFFLFNAAWMMLTAGVIYGDNMLQLCVNYLVDDQVMTSRGLIALGLALIALAAFNLRDLVASD